jgi:hypothetical protein
MTGVPVADPENHVGRRHLEGPIVNRMSHRYSSVAARGGGMLVDIAPDRRNRSPAFA